MSRARGTHRDARPPAPAARPQRADVSPGGELSSRDPALLFALAIAAACVLVSVSFRIYEYDLWQHLVFGKAIWQLREVPQAQLWKWPDHGAAVVNPSWGFSAVLWPFYAAWGEAGLAIWRWSTTLLVFALLWHTGRALGAKGIPALFILVLCALVYRQRSQVRPETLASVLLALELWLLRTRRGPVWAREAGLVAVLWAWVNVHISWALGLGLLVVQAVHGLARRGAPRDELAPRCERVLLVAAPLLFLNPFGWRAVWRPFEYAFRWRGDPFLSQISELQAIEWAKNLANGLPLLMAGWPLLIVWRWRQGRRDLVEIAHALGATALALSGARFVATYALLAAPWCARDFEELLAARRLRPRRAHPWRTALLTGAACVLACLYEWTHFENPPGIRVDDRRYPVRACDFMAREGIGGRGFNDFYLGGYQLFRFWPDRARLPFADIHPEDMTRAERAAYHDALATRAGWQALDEKYRFDYVLLSRGHVARFGMLDLLDESPGWSLVFVDDAAALYVRRDGGAAAVASREGFTLLPGGRRMLERLALACLADSAIASRTRTELLRQAGVSSRHSTFRSLRELVGLSRE